MMDYENVPCVRCGFRRDARKGALLCSSCRRGDPSYVKMTGMLTSQQRPPAPVDWDVEIARWRVDHPLPKPSTIM